jgi:DAK2 domain fusion protein YloV
VPIGPGDTWDGQELKRVLAASSTWLSRNAEAINALNVFPVPDGDTGTNMALTMQSAVSQISDSSSYSAGEIASGVSYGALMGARGNSGVILSQILRGFAESVSSKESISAADFADGLVAATATAYRAVLQPVEGTILTVIRETADRAKAAAAKTDSYTYMLDEATKEAKASVARTPLLLEKHREAGVVDAGGQGLYVLLDGMRRYIEGEDMDEAVAQGPADRSPALEAAQVHVEHGEYGYCTNFLLVGSGWNFDEVRGHIASLGDSAVIVGDDRLVKVHIHTETPGAVLNYATSLGSLRQISIANMQDQHEEFLQMHAGARATDGATRSAATPVAQSGIAVLTVAAGEGLVKAFRSMGASAIIEGGQTMNPSTQELLKAIESVPQNEVLLLPNNGNIILAARQSQGLTKKKVAVVPTKTVPQGMAALIAYNYESTLEQNAQAMQEAAAQVETGEITRAVRDATVNGLKVKAGDVIGLHNDKLVTKGANSEQVAWDLLKRMGARDREMLTIYWGGDLSEEQAKAFGQKVQKRYPDAEVELVAGGQPLYDYIISAE